MKDMPKRKNLRLRDFDYSTNGAYFITMCTAEKTKIFGTVVNGNDVVGADAHISPHLPNVELSPYGEIAKKYIETIGGIDKYVIMPDHIHMVVVLENGSMRASNPTPPLSISQVIRSYKTLVTKEIGQEVWQRGYYDHILRDYDDYLGVWQYIDENPLKWVVEKCKREV